MAEAIGLSMESALWLAMGFVFARAFGKRLDHDIQSSRWFKARSALTKNLLKRLMDFLHHWYIGLLLWLYAPEIILPTGFTKAIHYFGLGIFLDDLPDVPIRFRRYFLYLKG